MLRWSVVHEPCVRCRHPHNADVDCVVDCVVCRFEARAASRRLTRAAARVVQRERLARRYVAPCFCDCNQGGICDECGCTGCGL